MTLTKDITFRKVLTGLRLENVGGCLIFFSSLPLALFF